MALLVFSAADFASKAFPKIKQRKVSELLSPSTEDNAVGPVIEKRLFAAYESINDPCNTVDIPGELFQRVAPKIGDIGYLAHVREVDTGHKETFSFLADGWFSVVLGNRFPQPQTANTDPPLAVENRVFLVSLEGMEDYLPDGKKPVGGNAVRLAVLASWNFYCHEAYTFKTSMNKLKADGLKLPEELTSEEKPSDALKYVRDGFNRGYVALNHHTRLGEKTVSWYRGPLVPVNIQRKDYKYKPVPDSLLRYDFKKGMMDVTYAAASQLGRLLALQDRSFAKALCAYRKKVQSQVKESYRREELQRSLNAGEVPKQPTESQLLEFGLSEALNNQRKPRPSSGRKSESDLFIAGLEKVGADIHRKPPQAVCRWLSRLILLYRVPFSYLVPDERMLPPDSLRFFYLDPGWIKCLLEGACTVGRSSTEEQRVDEFLRNRFLDFAVEGSSQVRQWPVALRDAPETAAGQATAQKINWPLTGFLMRSPLVEGWQGLEMRAWQSWSETRQEGKLLQPLRIDRLAHDIMLCIFNGRVVRIEVRQPPEGMHFGAAPGGNAYFKYSLRRLMPKNKAGDQVCLAEGKGIQIPQRNDGDPMMRVVEVTALAEKLEKILKGRDLLDMDHKGKPHEIPESERVPAMDPEAKFTSAELGVQMTESPGRVIIEIPISGRTRSA